MNCPHLTEYLHFSIYFKTISAHPSDVYNEVACDQIFMTIIYPPALFLTLPEERPCFSLKYVSNFSPEVVHELNTIEDTVKLKVFINAV